MNGKYIIGEKDMKIKLEITLDELDILVDSLDSELQIHSAMQLPMYFVRPAKWKKYFNLINSDLTIFFDSSDSALNSIPA